MAEARFEGKVALITGAGSGIGRAVALRLASEGAQILAHDLNEDALAETAKLVADAGSSIATRSGDISSRDECVATVAATVEQFGGLDVLGNIAGIARAEHFPEVEERAYRQMMGVNVDACFFLAQSAIPHLLQRDGNVVNIASNAGLMGQAYTVAYCMTKGAIVQFTRALAMEYAKAPLRVNAIAPGGVDTSLSRNFQIPDGVDFELMARYTGFRSMGSGDDIAAMFALVASDEGRSIHGAILSVDRGITAG
jgi:meso-butanediol dehydrogenase / (S,S)-butanediol dehydrogenase / diacetyl reductase